MDVREARKAVRRFTELFEGARFQAGAELNAVNVDRVARMAHALRKARCLARRLRKAERGQP